MEPEEHPPARHPAYEKAAVRHGLRGVFCIDDYERIHSFVPSIAAKLVARGIIYQSEGYWRINNQNTNIVSREPWLAVCDFCDARPVVWDVEAESFIDAMGDISVANWAACEPCGQAILEGNREWLLTRVLKHRPRISHPMFRLNMALFWQNYRGITRMKASPFGH